MDTPPERLSAALEGRYEIQHELGAGGMATVYLARDVRHERDVAIKVLKPELAAVIGGERFITEIRTTANLQHPHILPLFDSGESDGFLYYVMPYVDGESLRDKLDRERQLGVDESIRIAKAVASALAYAHDEGVIHRDIKPENILLHRGQPVVADFGIALALSAAGGGRMTETGLSLGTPHYMSPEQATADRDLSARSDVYSLACVLYEMLAGDPPHTGPTAQAILMRILTDTPRSVTEVRSAVPPHIAGVLAKALEKLPADRFETAQEFDRALDDPGFSYATRARTAHGAAAATGAVGAAAGSPAASRTGMAVWLRDPRSIALMAGSALVLAIAAVAWPRAEPAPAPQPLFLDLDVGDLVMGDARYRGLAISPDGDAIVLAGTNSDGAQGLFLRRADETGFQFIPGTQDGRMPAFSPDGESIVYAIPGSGNAPGALMTVSLSGGLPLTLASGDSFSPYLPHWGEDGTVVFTGPGGLQRIPETGGTPEVLEASGPTYPHLLPDGSGILIDVRATGALLAGSSSIGILDPETLEVDTLIAEGVVGTYLHSGYILYAHPARGLFRVPFDLETHQVTGPPTPLLDGVPGDAYAVSRNGTLVYGTAGLLGRPAASSRDAQLLALDLEGNGGPDILPARPLVGVRWAPDGRSVAFTSGEIGAAAVYTYNIELGLEPKQLTFEGNAISPIWSPDGTRIVFALGAPTDRDLYVVSAVDDAPPERILERAGAQIPTDWPTDDVILFEDGTGVRGDGYDLWRLTLGDSAVATPYLPQDANLGDVVVGPNGDLAAYASNETGQSQVYVRSYPEPRQQTRISDGLASHPRWSADGRTIYYWVNLFGVPDTLYAARIETAPAVSVVSREVLLTGDFEPASWDIHPTEERFLVPQRVSAQGGVSAPDGEDATQPEEARFHVIVNWFEAIRERLEGGGR